MYVELQRPFAFPVSLEHGYLYGLGDMQSAQTGVAIGGAALGSGAAIAAAAHLIPAAAIPFIGPAIAAATLAVGYLVKNSGCGQTCIETSQWANQAEQGLVQNIQAYFAQPVPRSKSSQQVALANFDSIWNRLVQMCSDPSTGNAGKRCISDRQAGACKIRQTSDSILLAFPGEPQPGACWNWFSGYRDPIANDPNVVPDSALQTVTNAASEVSSSFGQALQTVGVSPSYATPLLLAALVGLGLWAVL